MSGIALSFTGSSDLWCVVYLVALHDSVGVAIDVFPWYSRASGICLEDGDEFHKYARQTSRQNSAAKFMRDPIPYYGDAAVSTVLDAIRFLPVPPAWPGVRHNQCGYSRCYRRGHNGAASAIWD